MFFIAASSFQFQSTPPSREATAVAESDLESLLISIHASLTGGDLTRET